MKHTTLTIAALFAIVFLPGAGRASDPTDVAAYVLLAEQELRAKGLRVDSGNLGVSAPGGFFLATRTLDAPDSLVAADVVRLRNQATCGEVLTNDLGGAAGACGPLGPLTVPTVADLAAACGFPTDPPPCDPDHPISLPRARNRVLHLEPGVYGGGPERRTRYRC
jgi:hypothetical protein